MIAEPFDFVIELSHLYAIAHDYAAIYINHYVLY